MKNGLAREREDMELDTQYATRVIRSHRMPATGNARRVITGAIVIVIATTALSASVNGVIGNHAPADAAGTHVTLSEILPESLAQHPPTLAYPLASEELRNENKLRREAELARQRAEAEARARRTAAERQVSRIETVIRYALAQQGDRYVFATAGPNTFDCSGLVLASFKQIGLKLPHFTGALIKLGTRVSRDDMQRGDLVFPQSGHVGIYLGGGQMVHASGSKQMIVVAKVYGFYAARRVI